MGEPVSAKVSQMPYITEYNLGEDLNLNGLFLDVVFTDGCVEHHGFQDLKVIDYDLSILGRRPVTVEYRGIQAVFFVTVVDFEEVLIDSGYPESPHPYLNNMDETYAFNYPGAIKIVFMFSEDTSVEDHADYLYVYDSYGNLVATYTKKEAAGQTIVVYGDAFSIKLASDDSYTDYGFAIDSIIVTTKIGSCEKGHTFSDTIEYVWAEDNSYVTAGYICKYCGELGIIEVVETTYTSTVTCTDAGETVYTAVFKSALLEQQTKTVEQPALGHDWGSPAYTWAEDHSSCTAAVVCSRDARHTITETAAAEIVVTVEPTMYADGSGTCYASFSDPMFEKQQKSITLPRLPKSGWLKEDGKWYYYKDDTAQTGWQKDGGKWYYFNDLGVMQKGWQKISGKWYYFNAGGDMLTGWKKFSTKWYYFNASGVMQTGWQKIDGKWYYFNEDGDMAKGWKQIGKDWYYFSSGGEMATGWQEISGKTYYFKPSGVMAANEWCKGWWLNKNGTWTYEYRASWKQDSKGWYYQDTSGWYAKNTTLTIDDKSYTFDSKGYLVE